MIYRYIIAKFKRFDEENTLSGDIMAKKRLLDYEEAQSEIFKALKEIKCNSDELRKIIEERLKVEHDKQEKEASE